MQTTILHKFQDSFRTESEIHCRFVPSWDGCSIPVPRSPLGIINGQIDNTSTRMRHKRQECATRCYQAPPNASKGMSTPAFRHMRSKRYIRLTRDLYPGHQAPPSATKRLTRVRPLPRASTKRHQAPPRLARDVSPSLLLPRPPNGRDAGHDTTRRIRTHTQGASLGYIARTPIDIPNRSLTAPT